MNPLLAGNKRVLKKGPDFLCKTFILIDRFGDDRKS
jgi:hypothetical protein